MKRRPRQHDRWLRMRADDLLCGLPAPGGAACATCATGTGTGTHTGTGPRAGSVRGTESKRASAPANAAEVERAQALDRWRSPDEA